MDPHVPPKSERRPILYCSVKKINQNVGKVSDIYTTNWQSPRFNFGTSQEIQKR